ncbi:MAG: ketopantoate reductase family protein [Blautia sp.]|nr:ketopantoate reductase family protein [Blautia sp.]
MINRIDIIGLGAVGAMYADYYTEKLGADHVRILADRGRIDRYRSEGIYINGEKKDFPLCVAEDEKTPSELLCFATKYGGLKAAIETVRHLVDEHTVIFAIINGIRSEEELSAAFGAEKVIYCTAQKMDAKKELNQVTYSTIGDLTLGITKDGAPERLSALTEFLDRAGFPYTIAENVQKALWSKLICNVGVNQAVAYYNGTYETVQVPGEPRDLMRRGMLECAAVAGAEGIDLTEKDVDAWISVIDRLTPESEPSMQQDHKAGRKTEVELFAGTVCSLGRKHGIETPVNDLYLQFFTKD